MDVSEEEETVVERVQASGSDQVERVRKQLHAWRRELLDLSRRQPLLYFKHTAASSLEIVAPDPVSALALVDAGQAVLTVEDGGLEVGNKDPEKLARSARRIDQVTRQALADRGVWTLYLGLGMLRWVDTTDHRPVESPLLLVPVQLHRDAASAPWKVTRSGDGASGNLALTRKLEHDEGVTLPVVDEDDPDVAGYLDAVAAAVEHRSGWSVEQRSVLRNFTFHKEAIYRDLEENEEQLLGHPLVQLMTLGADAPHAGEHDFTPPRDEDLDEVVPPEQLFSILPADSSQRRCVLAAREGRSFVMDGPPGTGKSQTIANIIAELIAAGRSVLFVSEKAAALDVVRSRLADRGLDDFLLELHSHTTGRREVAITLERALSERPRARAGLDGAQEATAVSARRDLNGYAAAMNDVRPGLHRSLFQVLGRLSSLPEGSTRGGPDDRRGWGDLTSARLAEVLQDARLLSQVWRPVREGDGFPWRSLRSEIRDEPSTVRWLRSLTSDLAQSVRKVSARVDAVDSDLPLGLPRTAEGVRRRADLLAALESAPDVPRAWLTTNDPAPVEARAGELGEAIDRFVGVRDELSSQVGPGWDALVTADAESGIADLAGARDLWDSLGLTSAAVLERATRVFADGSGRLDTVAATMTSLAERFGVGRGPLTSQRADELLALADLSQSPTPPEPSWLNPVVEKSLAESHRVLEALVTEVQRRASAVTSTFTRDALSADLLGLHTRLTQTHTGLRRWSGAARADRRTVKALTVAGRADRETVDLLREAIFWQRAEKNLDAGEADHAPRLGGYYRRTETDFARVQRALTVARESVRLVGRELDGDALARQLSTTRTSDPQVLFLAQSLRDDLASWRAALEQAIGRQAAARQMAGSLEDLASRCADAVPLLERAAVVMRRVESAAGRVVAPKESIDVLRRASLAWTVRNDVASSALRDAELLGARYDGLSTDVPGLRSDLGWVANLRRVIGGPVAPAMVDRLTSPTLTAVELMAPLDAWEQGRDQLVDAFGPERRGELAADLATSIDDAAEVLDEMAERAAADVPEWCSYRERAETLGRHGLVDLAGALTAARVPADVVPLAVEHAVLEAWVDETVAQDRRLATASARDRDELVHRFRTIDRDVVDLAWTRVVELCVARRPTSLVGDGAVIRREAQKKTRHLPIKKLLEGAGTVARTVKPCFMMSPLSVSQYLPSSMVFDVVIFDEASQVAPSDAINCVYRGQQLIVAGDQKQLPPTSFFARSADEEVDEDEDLDTFDSVLDLCKGAGALPALSLTWHYRSRHEDLITFSNHTFYDGRLNTFPGARFDAPDLGVASYQAHGVYRRGGARDNPVEAALVVERVAAHHREHPDLTMGVVALSGAQADAIEAALDQRAQSEPDLAPLLERGNRLDGFFIKNLESVQGDERDVIIFSTGYGPDENGKVTMNFGPLTRQGGWRRLNVAVTRARRRVEVVTSLHHSQIEPGANESHRHLRDYLHFAEKGRVALALDLDGSLGDVESPFEEEVLRVLTSWGHQVVPQVGAAGYRIDLAIRHPDRPGEYLMAVECDGAAYHSAKTARDRDRLREEVLVGLGWRVHRIWGLSWYRDRPGQEQRLREAIDAALVADGMPTVVVPDRLAPVEIEVVPVDLDAAPSWAEPYRAFPGNGEWCPYEPHTVDARPWLRRYLEGVLGVEAPVHLDLVMLRFRENWEIGRAGSRIQAAVDDALRRVTVDGAHVERDVAGFLRVSGAAAPTVRVPTELERRKAHQVPPEELREALRRTVGDAGSVSEDELSEAVARLFGWGRRGPDVRAVLSGATATLVESRVLHQDGQGRLTLARPS